MKKRLLQLSIFLFLATTTHAYYQAEQGRWLNRDPIGEDGGIHLYSIAKNNLHSYYDYLGLSTAYQDAQRNGAGGSNYYPDKGDFKDLRAAIDKLNGIKDKIDRSCFKVEVSGGGKPVTRNEMKKMTTNSHLIMFEGHGGQGGHLDFVDTGSLYFSSGVREKEATIEWAINRDGLPISPAQQQVIDGLKNSEFEGDRDWGRVRTYCCGGDIRPNSTSNPLATFARLTEDLESLAEKTYECCDSPIIISLAFGDNW